MTTRLTAKRFRTRRPDPVAPLPPRPGTAAELIFEAPDDGFGTASFLRDPAPAAANAGQTAASQPGTDLDAIRREGLTGRQLRLARRLAQKHNLPATSDFDAVRLLRKAGIDPFQKSNLLELVMGEDPALPPPTGRELATLPASANLPQTVAPPGLPPALPSPEMKAERSHAADIMRIQKDLARRRKRRALLLALRLLFFVGLPTLLAGYYYYVVATPLYAARSEFVIQQSSSLAAGGATGGLGGLLSGTGFATSQDSVTVQGYLQSRDAMLRLDRDLGYRAHFSAPTVDPIQRLDPQATSEAAYKSYSRNVHISYDPSEGLVRMEVLASDPAKAVDFSRALIGYAEEQVDQLTLRLREDQMQGARESYDAAEAAMLAAQRRVVELQEKYKVLSSEVEVQLITAQITQLETQLSTDRISLQQMESNPRPNRARMDPVIRRIAALEGEIAALRGRLTDAGGGAQSLAVVQSELLVAQADVQTRQLLLAQSLQAMEAARIEANRQTRYLSVSVNPTPPDEAAYPRAFENTVVALLIFGGIYLMISMTVAVLREQVSA